MILLCRQAPATLLSHPSCQSNWLPELQRVVASINTTFSAAFADIGCAGEVRLDDGGGEDYDKYSIQVWLAISL